MKELARIGETEVKPREYYLKKFGFEGKKEIGGDLTIQNLFNVDVVVAPEVIKN